MKTQDTDKDTRTKPRQDKSITRPKTTTQARHKTQEQKRRQDKR